MRMINVC